MFQTRPPQLTVACGVICENAGRILMVQETRAAEGVVFNQPVGKLEPHEDIFEGTCREVKEETGLDVELTDFLGAYTWLLSNGNTSIRFCFIARVACGELRRETRTDDEIVEPMWLSREELKQLETQFRNPVTKKCLADYFSGTRYPLAVVQTILDS